MGMGLDPGAIQALAEQRMRLYGAQEKVLERFFQKLEEEAAMVSQQRWGIRKQLVVFFGKAGIGTRGGWGVKAVLQACRKVVERPNSGRPADRLPGKVVTVNQFRTSRVSSAMNSPQPCEAELDRSKPTRPEAHQVSRLAAILSAPPSFVVGAAPGPDLTSGLAGTTAGGLAGGTGIGAGSGGPGNAGVGSAGATVGK
ncbi:hypothetical protein HaLaN_01769 [Haematococcus lacustris]|uniref:Uncharacterized protein n=1 Tax=Haematococcus lacustris TaxID=44745 RepID=A0A699YGK6_HAELA|nr:hypothetical protein HaLaN_01769 [Haematococcus lacustris]